MKAIPFLTALVLISALTQAQTTSVTYQGHLTDGPDPADGGYDMAIGLFSVATGGAPTATVTNLNVVVADGVFTTGLDFGSAAFDGTGYWLEFRVRPAGTGLPFTLLNPRQPLTPAPYAIHSQRAGEVTGGAVLNPTFLGTTTASPLLLHVNNQLALEVESSGGTPNLIGGYEGNRSGAGAVGVTIGGGGAETEPLLCDEPGTLENIADNNYATIGGGLGNVNSGAAATIGGGVCNSIFADAQFGTVGGGEQNFIYGLAGAISGGSFNTIGTNGFYGGVGGGFGNIVDVDTTGCQIGGGVNNIIAAGGFENTIAGGFYNYVETNTTDCFIGGGLSNTVFSSSGTIPGGTLNVTVGVSSFAAGYRAVASHDGSFVWGDFTESDVFSSNINEFAARASGGVKFYSNAEMTAGATLEPGAGSWSALSDRNMKENLEPVDCREALEKVSRLPMQTWNLKSQDPGIRHLGPMAQDFHAAFGLGSDERRITSSDADGVALAAIKGLHDVVREKEQEIEELRRTVAELKAMVLGMAKDK